MGNRMRMRALAIVLILSVGCVSAHSGAPSDGTVERNSAAEPMADAEWDGYAELDCEALGMSSPHTAPIESCQAWDLPSKKRTRG